MQFPTKPPKNQLKNYGDIVNNLSQRGIKEILLSATKMIKDKK